MSLNIRLEEIVKYYSSSAEAFCKELQSVSGENMRKLIKNPNANPGYHIIREILEKHPELSIRWFLFGEGKMLEAEIKSKAEGLQEGSIKYKGDLAERVRRLEEEVETLNFIFEIARDKKKAQELIRKRQNEITK